MTHTFIIAEAGSSHDNDLQKAYRLIEAAKECGADAVKFQWTSNGNKMAFRRGLMKCATEIEPCPAATMYRTYLEKPLSWLESLKAHADKVGIEFMCTGFLLEDIPVLAPLVKRLKVSAFESQWSAFVGACADTGMETIMSLNPGQYNRIYGAEQRTKLLLCISNYPTALEDLKLRRLYTNGMHGLSDHSTSLLTGALAVALGGRVIEKHIRLHDTDPKNPDYGHSLSADLTVTSEIGPQGGPMTPWTYGIPFMDYVRNIREAERAM